MTVIQHLSLDSFDVQDKQFESTNVYFLLNLGLKKKVQGFLGLINHRLIFIQTIKKFSISSVQKNILAKIFCGPEILKVSLIYQETKNTYSMTKLNGSYFTFQPILLLAIGRINLNRHHFHLNLFTVLQEKSLAEISDFYLL